MIVLLATGEISIFYLVSVAEETGLKLALTETTKTGFLAARPKLFQKRNIIKIIGFLDFYLQHHSGGH